MAKVTVNRFDINSAVEAAKKLKATREVYIVPTVGGYSIMAAKPQSWQNYVVVKPDGTTEVVKHDVGSALPCPKCQMPNPLPPHSLFIKCRQCGARLIKVKVVKK